MLIVSHAPVVDIPLRGAYLGVMKVMLRLLMIAVLAAFAAGAQFGAAGPAAAALEGAAGDPIMMQMADCQNCTAEQMQAAGDRCGSVCASPAIGLPGVQDVQPASEPATRLSEQRHAPAGQTRRPDPNPPRIS